MNIRITKPLPEVKLALNRLRLTNRLLTYLLLIDASLAVTGSSIFFLLAPKNLISNAEITSLFVNLRVLQHLARLKCFHLLKCQVNNFDRDRRFQTIKSFNFTDFFRLLTLCCHAMIFLLIRGLPVILQSHSYRREIDELNHPCLTIYQTKISLLFIS